MKKPREVCVILPNIRSVHNVGSFFRTCDAAGISHIYLSGVTPTPLDRFGRARADMAKVALGAEKIVPWSYIKNTSSILTKLKNLGFYIVAIEQTDISFDYKKFRLPKQCMKVAFICGEEVCGLEAPILKKTDAIVEIPMQGTKESLNVSVAFGIALFRILNI